MAMWCHGIDDSANSRASIFFTASIFSSRISPKLPSFFVRLVDEVPEDVIELLHVFCTTTFADVADQGCTRRTSVWRVSLILSPGDHVPGFKSSRTLYLLDHPQWFVCCRPVQDLVQSGFECSEVCFRAFYRQC